MVDIYRLLPEGTPIEVIRNRFYMSPSPNFNHFEVAKSIFKALDAFAEENNAGTVCYAPVDVFLGDNNAVQPDVFFISKENQNLINADGVYGAPDIVVEVLLPKNKNADLVKKKAEYEKFGVKEYFIVEPSDKAVITYYLQGEKYIEKKSYWPAGKQTVEENIPLLAGAMVWPASFFWGRTIAKNLLW